MTRKLIMPVALALLGGAAYLTPASAVQLPGGPVAAEGVKPLVETVQYGHCRAWRHECARRWGWGTWRFSRCLRLHGC